MYPDSRNRSPERVPMVFVCEDKESRIWLKNEVQHLDLGQPDLKARLVDPEELKVTKVITRLLTEITTVEDFLKLVRRQNGGVNTAK